MPPAHLNQSARLGQTTTSHTLIGGSVAALIRRDRMARCTSRDESRVFSTTQATLQGTTTDKHSRSRLEEHTLRLDYSRRMSARLIKTISRGIKRASMLGDGTRVIPKRVCRCISTYLPDHHRQEAGWPTIRQAIALASPLHRFQQTDQPRRPHSASLVVGPENPAQAAVHWLARASHDWRAHRLLQKRRPRTRP